MNLALIDAETAAMEDARGLKDVPVLDDPADLVEAEDVDAGVVPIAWPVLEAVEDHQVVLRYGPLELDALGGGTRPPSARSDAMKASFAVADVWVVLDVLVVAVAFNRLRDNTVEHQVVEGRRNTYPRRPTACMACFQSR